MKLNAGCYDDIKEGYVNLDKERYFKGIDVVHDLNKFPYPFKDNTFDEIYAKHSLEHCDPNCNREIFNEFYRISKPNAIIIAIVPYGTTWMNYIDHKRGYTFKTFLSLCTNDVSPKHITEGNFKIIKFTQRPMMFGKLIPSDYIRKILSYCIKNLINTIEVRMRVIK